MLPAGDPDIAHVEHRLVALAVHIVDDAAAQQHAAVGPAADGERDGLAAAPGDQVAADGVVVVVHKPVIGGLVQEDVLFRVYILLHIGVVIQMVGRKVGDDRDVGRAVHIVQLEAGELHDGDVRRLDVCDLGQQRRADVPALMAPEALRRQHLIDQRRRRRLAVRAGDAEDRAGAQLKNSSISLVTTAPRLRAAARAGTSNRRPGVRKMISSSSMPAKVVLAEHGFYAQVRERTAALPVQRLLAAVARRNDGAAGDEQLDKRRVAHADPDDGNMFSTNPVV